MTTDANLDPPDEEGLSGFSVVKLFLLYYSLFGREEGRVMFHILETEYQHYFEFFVTDVLLYFFFI